MRACLPLLPRSGREPTPPNEGRDMVQRVCPRYYSAGTYTARLRVGQLVVIRLCPRHGMAADTLKTAAAATGRARCFTGSVRRRTSAQTADNSGSVPPVRPLLSAQAVSCSTPPRLRHGVLHLADAIPLYH